MLNSDEVIIKGKVFKKYCDKSFGTCFLLYNDSVNEASEMVKSILNMDEFYKNEFLSEKLGFEIKGISPATDSEEELDKLIKFLQNYGENHNKSLFNIF